MCNTELSTLLHRYWKAFHFFKWSQPFSVTAHNYGESISHCRQHLRCARGSMRSPRRTYLTVDAMHRYICDGWARANAVIRLGQQVWVWQVELRLLQLKQANGVKKDWQLLLTKPEQKIHLTNTVELNFVPYHQKCPVMNKMSSTDWVTTNQETNCGNVRNTKVCHRTTQIKSTYLRPTSFSLIFISSFTVSSNPNRWVLNRFPYINFNAFYVT